MNWDAIRQSTPGVYERQAHWWQRNRTVHPGEAVWLARLGALLPPGARVLDIGCGAGGPVAAWARDGGFALTGIDSSPAMIELARTAHPEAAFRCADMRNLPQMGPFDALVSWDGLFHLSPAEQRAALPGLLARIGPGGAALMTVGPDAGEVTGRVNTDAVYHASLAPTAYAALFRAAGFERFTLTPDDPDCGGRSVILAAL